MAGYFLIYLLKSNKIYISKENGWPSGQLSKMRRTDDFMNKIYIIGIAICLYFILGHYINYACAAIAEHRFGCYAREKIILSNYNSDKPWCALIALSLPYITLFNNETIVANIIWPLTTIQWFNFIKLQNKIIGKKPDACLIEVGWSLYTKILQIDNAIANQVTEDETNIQNSNS